MYQTFRQTFYDRDCTFELGQKDAQERILVALNHYLINGLVDDSKWGKLSKPNKKVKVIKIETFTEVEFDFYRHAEVVRIHFTA